MFIKVIVVSFISLAFWSIITLLCVMHEHRHGHAIPKTSGQHLLQSHLKVDPEVCGIWYYWGRSFRGLSEMDHEWRAAHPRTCPVCPYDTSSTRSTNYHPVLREGSNHICIKAVDLVSILLRHADCSQAKRSPLTRHGKHQRSKVQGGERDTSAYFSGTVTLFISLLTHSLTYLWGDALCR